MPLEFTEPAAEREQWLRANSEENWRALRDVLGGNSGPSTPKQAPASP
jgi:hypothetical protein